MIGAGGEKSVYSDAVNTGEKLYLSGARAVTVNRLIDSVAVGE